MLSYIGGRAIQARLRKKRVEGIPSVPKYRADDRRARSDKAAPLAREDGRPLSASHSPDRRRIDPGRYRATFLARWYQCGLDIVSHYPTGEQRLTKRSSDATHFLIQFWQVLGLARYTRIDNERCFSGGFTHPSVLGKVLRLGL
jgi:hypothetical protein